MPSFPSLGKSFQSLIDISRRGSTSIFLLQRVLDIGIVGLLWFVGYRVVQYHLSIFPVMPPRRFTTLVVIAAIGLATLFLLSAATRQVASNAVPAAVQAKLPSFDKLPSIPFTIQKSAHRPPEQPNSTTSDTAWHSDWRWLNPFSSSVTLDEERAVLPPLSARVPVYTYYDTTVKVDRELAKVNKEAILIWKRAWWAHGFRPVVLTQAEALKNPLSMTIKERKMARGLEAEFWRWLAWGHMGTGLLADWRCIPMSDDSDDLLASLRRGEFEKITGFKELGAGLFAGEKKQINAAVDEALRDMTLETHKEITTAISEYRLKIESASSIANYDTPTIKAKFPKLSKMIKDDPVKGYAELNQLMTSHLHTIWQNSFSSGISVLKPLPKHTTELVKPGQHLATLLTKCPPSFLQSSCPPNKPKCKPCVGSKMNVKMEESFKNSSTLFTIVTIPHPYTMISLNNLTSDPTVAHIRRNTDRDAWTKATTRTILGDGLGGAARVVGLKDAIASDYSRNRGLWFTVEHFPADFNKPPSKPKSPTNDMHPDQEKIAPFPEHWLEELDWHFGFSVPRTTVDHGESYSPIPGIKDIPKDIPETKVTSYDPAPPTYVEEQREVELLRLSRETIKSKDKHTKQMRGVAEAWNLADTEIWRFARAYRARSIVERKQWEEEEEGYGPGSPRGGGGWW